MISACHVKEVWQKKTTVFSPQPTYFAGSPIFKDNADKAFDAATCIGCGACVAVCKNSSAMLFVSAKINQYLNLPQGRVEHNTRLTNMVGKMDEEEFDLVNSKTIYILSLFFLFINVYCTYNILKNFESFFWYIFIIVK